MGREGRRVWTVGGSAGRTTDLRFFYGIVRLMVCVMTAPSPGRNGDF